MQAIVQESLGSGALIDSFFEITFGDGVWETWARQLVQTLYQTDLGHRRDRFKIRFEQVAGSQISPTPSKTLSRKLNRK